MRRVVITGIGAVSALGPDAKEFWRNLSAGNSGIRPIEGLDLTDVRIEVGAQVTGFDPTALFDEKFLFWLDPFAQYGLAAAIEAIADSGIEFDEASKDRTGVVTGSCLGGKTTEEGHYRRYYKDGITRQPPTIIPKAMGNAVASHVSMKFGFTGPTFTTSTACSSSNHAVGQAFWLVRQGTLDYAVAGGSELSVCLGNLRAWESMRVVAPDTCRPFSKDRAGMILGDGAAMFVLETLDSALARGARIYAEIVGFGMSADAYHLTMPLAAGAAKAMRAAIDDSDLDYSEVGYVNAHGTGTMANDAMETEALKIAFGEHARNLAVSSTKSMHGHTLGAAGAIESAATVLALHHGILPPTANFNEPDPNCDLDVIANEPRTKQVEAAISNSFAFGGLNAVLAFKAWRG